MFGVFKAQQSSHSDSGQSALGGMERRAVREVVGSPMHSADMGLTHRSHLTRSSAYF